MLVSGYDSTAPHIDISDYFDITEISHNRHKRNSEGGELNRHDYGDEETYSYAHQMQVFEQVNHAMHYLSVAILAVFVIEVSHSHVHIMLYFMLFYIWIHDNKHVGYIKHIGLIL